MVKKLIIFTVAMILYPKSGFEIEVKPEFLTYSHLQQMESSSEEAKSGSDIESILKKESAQIGFVDENSEHTEKRLKELAKDLRDGDLMKLKEKSLASDLNGDERMLSVYLLSLSQEKQAAQFLEEIALSSNYSNEFETVIRLRAIEGLQNRSDSSQAISSLDYLISKLSDAYLLERTQRALSYYSQQTDKLEEQDLKALKNLINF